MRPKSSPFGLAVNIDSLIAGIIAFVIIQIFCRHSGIGISPDSVTYISSARHLGAGKGLTAFDGKPMVDFPAFYPLFLSALSLITRLDPVVYGPVLNGLLFFILIYLCGSIMNTFQPESKWYKRILLSVFILSPALLEIYSMMWSETIFILLVILFIITARNYFQKYSTRSLMLLSAVVGIACVTRYAGIVLMGTGGLLIILDPNSPFPRRIKHLIAFSVVSSLLLIINLGRNLLVTGYPAGIRQKGTTSFLGNIYFFGRILTDWFPVPATNTWAVIVTLVTLIICIVVFVRLFSKKATYHSYEGISAAFCVVYFVFMILSATISRYEQFTNRLLSPLYIPLFWSLSHWMVPSPQWNWRKKVPLATFGILLAVGLQYHQWLANYETYDGVKDAGIPGYTEDPFPQSDIVSWLQANKTAFKPGYTIYSNAADAVYFFTSLTSHLLPQDVFPHDIQHFYGENHHYLVWFYDVDNPDLISLQEILQNKHMTLLHQFNSGAIFVCENSKG
ncbi:MAG: hypothetical protein C5B59_01335 [Bacteroidetes bacterium]|nr:MAG: hypothetical protein C5B59_01335 [Bacteroidota bacterium]